MKVIRAKKRKKPELDSGLVAKDIIDYFEKKWLEEYGSQCIEIKTNRGMIFSKAKKLKIHLGDDVLKYIDWVFENRKQGRDGFNFSLACSGAMIDNYISATKKGQGGSMQIENKLLDIACPRKRNAGVLMGSWYKIYNSRNRLCKRCGVSDLCSLKKV